MHFPASILLLCCAAIHAQDAIPRPVAGAPNLLRAEGFDSGSGIHYLRLMLSSPLPSNDARQPPPRFTVECRDKNGKHDLLWFVSFGGVADPGFEPPFHPTQTDLFPPHYPNAKLKMGFEGYTKWKPVIKAWVQLPSGEFRFCNSGIDCPNMETARYYMQFLNALPGLRISYANPARGAPAEAFFQTRPLLDEINKNPVCAP